MTKTCKQCGKSFKIVPAEAYRRRCCSRPCADNRRRKNGLSVGKILNTGYHGFSLRGKTLLAHRQVMATYLERPLEPQEVVHHRNGNKMDNRIENLELFVNHAEHMRQRHNPRDRRR